MEDVNKIYKILTDLGYKLKDYGKEYRTRPLYRNSDNDSVLKIYKDTGHWFDFKENISGDFTSLINKTLKLDNVEEAKEWLKTKNFNSIKKHTFEKPLLKETKIFEINSIEKLIKDHSYWINRNISLTTLNLFEGGIAKSGKMKNRYVFPIFNNARKIIGLSGRDITNKNKIKWKHLGEKNDWVYPLFLNKDFINDQVYLVESIGDCLALWEGNIKNVIVTFGLNVNLAILNFLLRANLKKINISFNNDLEKNSAGNIAAEKTFNKLLRYFDKDQLNIKLPPKKDFGEMSTEEINQWKIKI